MKMLKKKKFKDRKIGKFLKEFAPDVLEDISDIVPDFGALKIVAKLIDRHPTLSDGKKSEAKEIIIEEIKKNVIAKNVTNLSIVSAVGVMFGTIIGVSENCMMEIVAVIMQYFG